MRNIVLKHPSVRAQDVDVLVKVGEHVVADEHILVTTSADMDAFIGIVMDAVALQGIGCRGSGDVDAIPGVPARVPVVMHLVVDEAIVVGTLQTDATL